MPKGPADRGALHGGQSRGTSSGGVRLTKRGKAVVGTGVALALTFNPKEPSRTRWPNKKSRPATASTTKSMKSKAKQIRKATKGR